MILRNLPLWAALPALLLTLYGAHNALADRRAAAAAASATRLCDATWRAREAAANAHAWERADEIRRHMDAVRPDPARVPERLRDGSFLLAPSGAAGDDLP